MENHTPFSCTFGTPPHGALCYLQVRFSPTTFLIALIFASFLCIHLRLRYCSLSLFYNFPFSNPALGDAPAAAQSYRPDRRKQPSTSVRRLACHSRPTYTRLPWPFAGASCVDDRLILHRRCAARLHHGLRDQGQASSVRAFACRETARRDYTTVRFPPRTRPVPNIG